MVYLQVGDINENGLTRLTIEGTDIEKIRDAFNRGYEKGYAKGKADELQAVKWAQADRDRFNWQREIKKE